MPNLAAISYGVGTGAPKVQNVIKFAVFSHLSTQALGVTADTDRAETGHERAHHKFTLLCIIWPWWVEGMGGQISPKIHNLAKCTVCVIFAPQNYIWHGRTHYRYNLMCEMFLSSVRVEGAQYLKFTAFSWLSCQLCRLRNSEIICSLLYTLDQAKPSSVNQFWHCMSSDQIL